VRVKAAKKPLEVLWVRAYSLFLLRLFLSFFIDSFSEAFWLFLFFSELAFVGFGRGGRSWGESRIEALTWGGEEATKELGMLGKDSRFL
jgi:hypothetical protein